MKKKFDLSQIDRAFFSLPAKEELSKWIYNTIKNNIWISLKSQLSDAYIWIILCTVKMENKYLDLQKNVC